MSHVHPELLYTKDHEWVKPLGATLVRIGITDFAQSSLGDVTYVQIPAPGTSVQKGKGFGTVESVKAVSDLYAPVTGIVRTVNAALNADPSIINREPYEGGWLIEVEMQNAGELHTLLKPDAYATMSQ